MWAEEYHNVLVITIAHEDIEECAFSADTGMAECLVVAKKGKRKNTGRGTFVCLKRVSAWRVRGIGNHERAPQVQKYPPVR